MSLRGGSGRSINSDYAKLFHKLRQEGRTYKEIADRFRVGETTVSKAIKRYLEAPKD
jgi:transposase